MKYRLYVDEVGNHDLQASKDPNHRYLSLTGVIVELDYVRTTLHPQMEALKTKYFQTHPDEPLIFHRKELSARKYPFAALLNPEVEKEWNQDFLALLQAWHYEVITVTIDKLEHLQRYSAWRYDPYHYCLKVLIERYTQCLQRHELQGDVIAESRGGREDKRLKKSFTRVYDEGSEYIKPVDFQKWLTSKQLKVEPKRNNIAGLQLADLVGHASYKLSVFRHNNEKMPDNFASKIANILLKSKYYRSKEGKIDGWGIKWLP